jgi:hypothetical protein
MLLSAKRLLIRGPAIALMGLMLASSPACTQKGCPAKESLKMRENRARRQKRHKPKSGLFDDKVIKWNKKNR